MNKSSKQFYLRLLIALQHSGVSWKRRMSKEDKMLEVHPLIAKMDVGQFLNLVSLTTKGILSSCSKLQTTLVVITKATFTRRSMVDELAIGGGGGGGELVIKVVGDMLGRGLVWRKFIEKGMGMW